jgi:hypothetical protein
MHERKTPEPGARFDDAASVSNDAGREGSRRRDLAIGAFCVVLAILTGLAFAPFTYDDGYITYRYADNLSLGRGLVFNPGENVLGTTAPMFAVLLAGLTALTRSLSMTVAAWGTVVSLLSLAAAVVSLQTFRREGGPLPGAAQSVVLAVMVFAARWNIEMIGCENMAVLGLVSAAFAFAFARRGEVVPGVLAGLAASLRFDAGLAAAALGILLWVERRKLPWRYGLAGLLPIAGSLAWLHSTFGTFLPNTLQGKRSELALVTAGYLRSEFGWLVRSFDARSAPLIVALALAGLVATCRLRGRPLRFAIAFGGWLSAHELLYRVVGVPFAPWYHIAAINALLALAVAGAFAIGEVAASALRPRGGRGAALTAAAAGVLLVALPLASSAAFIREHLRRPPDPRIRVYRDVALEIAARAKPESSVAAVEIGALAYFSDCRVLDLVGLVDPEVLRARGDGTLARLVWDRKPDFIVDNPGFHASFLAPLVEGGELERRYREVAVFRRPEYPHAVRLLERVAPAGHE